MFVSALITLEYYYLEVVNRMSGQDYLGALIIILVAITPSILIYFISEEMKVKTRKPKRKKLVVGKR